MSDAPLKRSGFRADSLIAGMAVMLVLTVVQRGIGFIRGVWFCRLLDDNVLGQWAMAHGFITLVTPMMLFGIPGCLPRFVEHYRLRGQLGWFVGRVLIATGLCTTVFFAIMFAFPSIFGWVVFLEPQSNLLIYCVGIAVVSTITLNFVNDLVASLRLVRVVSIMQFIQGVAFTVAAVVWLQNGGGLVGLVLAFTLANSLALIPGLLSLKSGWEKPVGEPHEFDSRSMWQRLLPYAAAIWAMNLLGNTFELSDRYMLLHLTPGGDADGQAAVGQYHSGRIFPTLMMSIAMMLGGILMPYMTADWEAGRYEQVRTRLRRGLLAVAVVFTVGAAMTDIFSPFIFGVLLEGRYDDGLSVMPMAFIFTTWSALVMIGQNYLWVLERGKWIALAMGVGLAANIALNAALIPVWGLSGAVLATLTSNLVVLMGLWICLHRSGCPLDHSAVLGTVLPATLLAGPWASLLCCLVVALINRDAQAAMTDLMERFRRRRVTVSSQ